MNKTWLVAFALLLASVAALAAPAPAPAPAQAPALLSDAALASILGAPLGASCAKAQPAAARHAGGGSGLALKAMCTATCQGGGTVSCSGSSCNAVNADCSFLEAGHVTCDGVTTTCTPACCTSGTPHDRFCCRCEATGDCFDCCRCDGGGGAHCALQCS